MKELFSLFIKLGIAIVVVLGVTAALHFFGPMDRTVTGYLTFLDNHKGLATIFTAFAFAIQTDV